MNDLLIMMMLMMIIIIIIIIIILYCYYYYCFYSYADFGGVTSNFIWTIKKMNIKRNTSDRSKEK